MDLVRLSNQTEQSAIGQMFPIARLPIVLIDNRQSVIRLPTAKPDYRLPIGAFGNRDSGATRRVRVRATAASVRASERGREYMYACAGRTHALQTRGLKPR